MSAAVSSPVLLSGCLPEHAEMPAVGDVLAVLTSGGVPLADVASVSSPEFTGGAVVSPVVGATGWISVRFYVEGRSGEIGLPPRLREQVRAERNRALDMCAEMLQNAGHLVSADESKFTRTRRVESLTVRGAGDSDLAREVAAVLASVGLEKVAVLRGDCADPSRYRINGEHFMADVVSMLEFSPAVSAETVRAAVVALRAQGFDARESYTGTGKSGYGLDVTRDGRPLERADGDLPDTQETWAARNVLWEAGFSRENVATGTIGHRVYPQLPPHLRGLVTRGNTPGDVIMHLHDRVSVTVPANAYADGLGPRIAENLSSVQELAFTTAGWDVVREDPTTITVQRRRLLGEVSAGQPVPVRKANRRGPVQEQPACSGVAHFVDVAKASSMVGVAVRLVCPCGSTHWAKGVDGGYKSAETVPVEEIARHIRGEGYEIAGDWSVRAIGGEFPHTVHRAPVVPTVPTPSVGVGEEIRMRTPGHWVIAVDGQVYTLWYRRAGEWEATDSRWQPIVKSPVLGEVLVKVRMHRAENGPAGIARGNAARILREARFEPVSDGREGFEIYTDFNVDGRWTGGLLVIHTRNDGREPTTPADVARSRYWAALRAAGWTERPIDGSTSGLWEPPAPAVPAAG